MDGDVAISQENGLTENDEKPTDIDRLHGLVNKVETDNVLPSSSSEKTLENGFHNGHTTESDIYSLESTTEVTDPEFNQTINSEDENSWIYESPQKMLTPGKKIQTPEKWLTENITTPELMRVRGSLSAKLDVMKIEKRKGLYHTDPQHRKISNIRKESMYSVNSLDWDYDEEKDQANESSRNRLINDGLDDDDFDPEKELSLAYQKISSDLIERQAWSEPAVSRGGQLNANDARPFSLDWSDDEDELVPMKIDFNSPPSANDVKPRGAVVRRSAGSAAPRQAENFEHEDFAAKTSGMVKPKRAVAPRVPESEYEATDFSEDDDFNDCAPVVPRGAPKRARRSESLKVGASSKQAGGQQQPLKHTESLKRTTFAENILIHPISADQYGGRRKNHSEELLKKVHNTPSPRLSAGIAKPAQRRKPSSDTTSNSGIAGVRPRGSIGQIKPRGSASIPKSFSAPSDVGDSSLVAKIPSGDGAVVRRRGAGGDADGIPAPRKSKESPQVARIQEGLPQARKSTGSLPQPRKSSEAGVRPRGSASPSGIARPRGSGATTQSMQANY